MHPHKNIRLLYWFNFFTDFDPFGPFAVVYFTAISGSFALGMSVFSIQMVLAALFEVPTGIFSDMIGRRMTIILGSVCHLAAMLFLAIGGSYSVLIFGAVCAGLGRAFYSGNNEAFLYDTLLSQKKEGDYHHFLGKTSSMFQVALAISAVTGSFIALWSISAVVWTSVISKAIRLAIAFFFVEPPVHSPRSGNVFTHLGEALQQFRLNAKLRWMSLASITRFGLGEVIFLFRSAFYQTVWPVWALGFAFMLSHIGAAVGYFYSNAVVKKFTLHNLLVFEFFINRIISVVGLAFPTIASPVILSSTSLFYGVADIAKSAILQREFTQAQRATLGSINSFLGSILFSVVAVGVGSIADWLGPANTLLLVQALFLPLLYFYWKFFQEEKKGLDSRLRGNDRDYR